MSMKKNEALPGFEPRSLESESNALTNYAITPTKVNVLNIKSKCDVLQTERIELPTSAVLKPRHNRLDHVCTKINDCLGRDSNPRLRINDGLNVTP